MGIGHVLNRVCDNIAAWQRIEHARVTHGNTIINGDGIEFLGNTAGLLDLFDYELTDIMQMDVTWYKLSERISHSDDRLTKIAILYTSSLP